MKPYEVFKVGTHKAENGKEIPFTLADLEDIAASFNADERGAPMVYGHPKGDDPAYGWTERFTVEGGRLVAHPKDVHADFAASVRSGQYPQRSISFWPKQSPYNPTPGKYYPKHIGFLGAQPPAISGLKAVEFKADDDSLCFAADEGQILELTDEAGVSWLSGFLGRLFSSGDAPQFSISTPPQKEDMTMSKDQGQEDARNALELERQKLAEDQAAFAASKKAARDAEDAAFVTGLVESGKLAPGAKDDMAAFMATLSDGDDELNFSVGDGDTATNSPRAYLRGLLSAAKPLVNFGAQSDAPKGGVGSGALTAAQIAQSAASFQAEQADKGITISIDAAVKHVTSETQG